MEAYIIKLGNHIVRVYENIVKTPLRHHLRFSHRIKNKFHLNLRMVKRILEFFWSNQKETRYYFHLAENQIEK